MYIRHRRLKPTDSSFTSPTSIFTTGVSRPCPEIREPSLLESQVLHINELLQGRTGATSEKRGGKRATSELDFTSQDSSADEWNQICIVKGDKAATRANTFFDLITCTGVVTTEHHISRVPRQSTNKGPSPHKRRKPKWHSSHQGNGKKSQDQSRQHRMQTNGRRS